uniref:Thioredoxin domain-containing protein n=1 Tax=Davidia involucrata TaxID=16924 RepID=A0A5B7BAG1_DAVIN
MALQLQASLVPPSSSSSSSSSVRSPPSASSWSPKHSILCFIGDHRSSRVSRSVIGGDKMREKHIISVKKGMCVRVRSSLDTAGPVVGQVTAVTKDTFWPIVNAAGDKTVVLDMYTQWCGPCKVMAPKFQELSKKYHDVVFLKLDCNQDNRPLAKELGIRVVPTFKILKDNKIVKEVTGAKFDDLVVAIESVRSS